MSLSEWNHKIKWFLWYKSLRLCKSWSSYFIGRVGNKWPRKHLFHPSPIDNSFIWRSVRASLLVASRLLRLQSPRPYDIARYTDLLPDMPLTKTLSTYIYNNLYNNNKICIVTLYTMYKNTSIICTYSF